MTSQTTTRREPLDKKSSEGEGGKVVNRKPSWEHREASGGSGGGGVAVERDELRFVHLGVVGPTACPWAEW